MRNSPTKLALYKFGYSCPLQKLRPTLQQQYIVRYLTDLGATTALEEPQYFDRDYLAEFSAFYSKSSSGYPNTCKRLHFFAGPPVTRATLRRASAGSRQVQERLQTNYLGFVIIRPIPAAPFGRTVLVWYPDKTTDTPRVVSPSRNYHVHVAGLKLKVHGLAWQQQDSGVGACATVGLWSMLHTSALDDHHAVPTTAQITEAAHKTASMGSRVFPSAGLNIAQVCEAIKENDLSPILFNGDLARIGLKGFSAERFASSCAAFIRSGYPVLIVGNLENAGLHAVCAVGFRSCAPEAVDPGEFGLQDANIPHLYIHDDNLGPNIRFRVRDNGPGAPVMIQPDSPPSPTGARPDPLQGYPSLTPHLMLVAAHNDLRTSPDTLHGAAIRGARLLTRLIDHVCRQRNLGGFGITVSARYIMLADYVTNELWQVLHNQAAVLSRVRLALAEKVRPMSLHLGVIRIGMDDGTLLADVLYDTTDSDRNHPAFAFLYYQEIIGVFMRAIENTGEMNFGTPVPAC